MTITSSTSIPLSGALASILEVLPHDGPDVLFTGRVGAIRLADGRALVVTPASAEIVDSAPIAGDNKVAAPDDAVPAVRPAYLDCVPLFGSGRPSPRFTEALFWSVWKRRDEPDDYVRQDPYTGGLIRVAQALRRARFRPLCLACSLHIGESSDPGVAYQLKRTLQGVADAACMFELPVIATELELDSGCGADAAAQVAAYGVEAGEAIAARSDCPVIEPFVVVGDIIAVIGRTTADLSGSLLLPPHESLPPPIDLIAESRAQEVATQAAPLLNTLTAIGRGGLLVTLARCCSDALGARIHLATGWEGGTASGVLFGEAQSRFVTSLPAARLPVLEGAARKAGSNIDVIGAVAPRRLTVEGLLDISVEDLRTCPN